MNLEMAELIERLPHKSWKSYNPLQKIGWESEEQKLETWYEYIDVFHFFLNVGLLLGITADDFVKLYITKNKENFDRQKRGY
jgi:dimeric dUTPase (all-alpha-NTP-PPase superfamily)